MSRTQVIVRNISSVIMVNYRLVIVLLDFIGINFKKFVTGQIVQNVRKWTVGTKTF